MWKWLIYSKDDSDKLLAQLRHINLQVDADVKYASLNDRQQSQSAVFDVYNNGYHAGGRLNVTFDRFFKYENGVGSFTESIIQRKRKYENRNNMSDVTLRSVGVVSVYTTINGLYIKN